VSRRLLLQKPFTRNMPLLTIRVAIRNPISGRQTSFDQECWVDTGFSGGLHVPQYHESDMKMIGVEPRPTTVRLAGGVPGAGQVCVGYVQCIEGHNLPSPGIQTELLMHGGETHGLLGLSILRSWITEFDGPKQVLSIYD